MKLTFRAVAVSLTLSLAWSGALASFAFAQQPPPPPAQQPPPPPAGPIVPAPAQPSAPAQMFQEQVKPAPEPRGVDIYDVGAVVATAAGLPFKTAICGLGTAFSIVFFAATFASRADASAEMLHEACGGKAPWIVRGSDLRPRPTVSRAFDWEQHRFQWEK
jgi:hypothetical protein